MSMVILLVRILVSVGFLWFIVRISGKHALGDAHPLDFIVAILLANLTKYMLLGQVSLPEGLVAIGLLGWMHMFVHLLSQRSPALQKRFWGDPVLLVRDGRLQRTTLARARITYAQFDSMLRGAGIERLSDVQEMRLESDGKVSIIRREGTRPLANLHLLDKPENPREEGPWSHAA